MSWTRLALPVALLASAPAAGQVSDFRLPADQPTPPSDVQGPVAPDVPASRRLGPQPTPTPTASPRPDPATTPTAETPPIEVPEGLQALPAARQTPRPAATGAPVTTATAPIPEELPPSEGSPAPPPSIAPSAPLESEAAPREGSQGDWPGWWPAGLAAAVLVAALGLIAWLLRRRVATRKRVAPATVERPRVSPGAPLPSASPPAAAEPLDVSLEPLRLSLTLINATLAYRLEVANRGATALIGLSIAADMISAHASLSREEQLSGPRPDPATVQRIDRLEPGESRIIAGEFRLPLAQVLPIRQGSAALLLPLARFRVEGGGAGPVVRTYVVGQPGQGNGLQPFRLDLGPRIYPRLAQHAFA